MFITRFSYAVTSLLLHSVSQVVQVVVGQVGQQQRKSDSLYAWQGSSLMLRLPDDRELVEQGHSQSSHDKGELAEVVSLATMTPTRYY